MVEAGPAVDRSRRLHALQRSCSSQRKTPPFPTSTTRAATKKTSGSHLFRAQGQETSLCHPQNSSDSTLTVSLTLKNLTLPELSHVSPLQGQVKRVRSSRSRHDSAQQAAGCHLQDEHSEPRPTPPAPTPNQPPKVVPPMNTTGQHGASGCGQDGLRTTWVIPCNTAQLLV